MPSCEQRSTYWSEDQRLYSRQSEQLLTSSREFHHFRALKEQTESLRLSWLVGSICIFLMIYFDAAMTLSGMVQNTYRLPWVNPKVPVTAFWGATLNFFPPVLAAVAALSAIVFGFGNMLVAPWLGWSGDVEDVHYPRLIVGHVCAAAAFAWQPLRPVGLFLPADYDFITTFIGALAPLIVGLLFRNILCSAKWNARRLLPGIPMLWLPVVYSASVFFLWIFLIQYTVAIRTGTSLTFNVIPHPRLWLSSPSFLISILVAGEVYTLLLMGGLIEAMVALPIAKVLLLPRSPRMFAIYVVVCCAALYHFYTHRDENGDVSFIFVGIATYLVGLFFNGIPDPDE